MEISLFEHPERISKEELELELLSRLPEWRREQALRYKFLSGQVLCAKSYLMLDDLLRNRYGLSDKEFVFDILAHGKPILHGHPEIHFSMSHCKDGILCVVDDAGPVGCDIESLRHKYSEALLNHVCNEEEKLLIHNAEDSQIAFIELWTKKEAYLKYTGEGISNDLRSTLCPELLSSVEIVTATDRDNGFAYSICRQVQP